MRGKGRGAKEREGSAEHKSSGARGSVQRGEHGRRAARRALLPSLLLEPVFCRASLQGSVWLAALRHLGDIGAAEPPPSDGAAQIPHGGEGRVRFHSWRAKGGREG